jgi:hypothetical protein
MACVLLAFDSPDGTVVPAAGAGGTLMLAGSAAGAAAFSGDDMTPDLGGLGMYRGPVWPQAESSIETVRTAGNANEDFTIRITV